MSIDRASIFAERYRANPVALQQAVLGVGGQTVTDPYTALRALQLLKQSQAMQSAQAAQAPTNMPSIAAEAVTPQPNQPMQGLNAGLGAMPVPTSNYAMGGMVAFADGGVPHFDGDEGSLVVDNEPANLGGDYTVMDPYMERVRGIQPHVIDKDADNSAIANEMRRAQGIMGRGDPYAEFRTKLASEEAGSAGELEKGKGLAMLQAAGAILEPGGLARGLGKAGQAFSAAYGDVLKADRAAKQARSQMRFNLADAERKEKLGLYKDAAASIAAGHANAIKGQQFEIDKIKAEGTLAAAQARLKAGNKAGAQISPTNLLFNAKEEYRLNPTPENAAKVKNAEHSIDKTKTTNANIYSVSDITGNKAAQGETGLDIKQQQVADQQKKLHGEELRKIKRSIEYLDANPATKEQMVEAIDEKYPLAKHGKVIAPTPAAARPTRSGNIPLPSGFIPD